MDTIILGFLMIRGSTIYELRQSIKQTLSNVSSDSTGSIQAGIKKLLKKEWITFEEHIEGSVNKKTYYITEAGVKHFRENISTPMLYKEKNMELSKFFFQGFADHSEHEAFINSYLEELEKELHRLEAINITIDQRNNFSRDYINNLKEAGGATEFMTEEGVKSIAYFQYATLDLGIEKIKFEIDWFRNFQSKLKAERMENDKGQ
ncbi:MULTISPECIES: PadR family transcriptional regulator [Oceanobacillus]|uniref:PadR family transcriptional regulator n=1 Tax=Oceanobacillus aidingensis TaxID=645964 RepID=A0ABV9K125_9BACI|nr:PadR family transcriptional regulator [Oceanobacillus oncorhynchi]MDM8101863.1 PadR family transcriptional regulator [Oceanobacillus oncorhynchi]